MRATPTHSLGALTSIIAGKSPMNGREREREIYIYISILYVMEVWKGKSLSLLKSMKILDFPASHVWVPEGEGKFGIADRFLPWHGGFLEVIPRVVVDENVILGCWPWFTMLNPKPSGKRWHNYGKSPFLIGKSTINGPFSIAMLVYQRVSFSEHQSTSLNTGSNMINMVKANGTRARKHVQHHPLGMEWKHLIAGKLRVCRSWPWK